MSDGQWNVGIALASRRSELLDVSARADADVAPEPGGELPFEDRAVRSIALGDDAGSLVFRDQVQLLSECRRVLAPGGSLTLVEPRAVDVHAALARCASMVGLYDAPRASAGSGWVKPVASTDTRPLVSILVPAYNPRYFRESLASAMAQTYRNVEIIICDDSEGDAIPAIVESFATQASIRYFKNPVRLRARRNYEKCLSLARGEYIKFLNDDDVLESACVEVMLDAFLRVPDLTLATSHRWRIDASSTVIEDLPATLPVVDRDLVIEGVSLANAIIMYGLNFAGEPSTALFRKRDLESKSALDDPRPFQFNGEEVRGAIDLAIWSRLLVQGNAAFFDARLSRFRSHSEQEQARPDVVEKSIAGIRGLQREWIKSGLFRRYPPHLLLCQTLEDAKADSKDWSLVPLRTVVASKKSPEEEVSAWRTTERHAFDRA